MGHKVDLPTCSPQLSYTAYRLNTDPHGFMCLETCVGTQDPKLSLYKKLNGAWVRDKGIAGIAKYEPGTIEYKAFELLAKK